MQRASVQDLCRGRVDETSVCAVEKEDEKRHFSGRSEETEHGEQQPGETLKPTQGEKRRRVSPGHKWNGAGEERWPRGESRPRGQRERYAVPLSYDNTLTTTPSNGSRRSPPQRARSEATSEASAILAISGRSGTHVQSPQLLNYSSSARLV